MNSQLHRGGLWAHLLCFKSPNLQQPSPVHHETETKGPFRAGLSINRPFPVRRSHSSILAANSWHWMMAGPTSGSFLFIGRIMSLAGRAPSPVGTAKHNEGFCLRLLLRVTRDHVKAAAWWDGRSIVQREVTRQPITWRILEGKAVCSPVKQDSAEKRHTFLI